MGKVLVLCEAYPNKGVLGQMYIHTRNVAYQENGIDVRVVSFSANEKYVFEGIPVITLADYKHENEDYDVLICHAANIRHHYLFLRKYGNRFRRFVFFFHGHEVLMCNKVYPVPYSYNKKTKFKEMLKDLYDLFKLVVWRKYYTSVSYKSEFVFVSKWMLDEFLQWTKIPFSIIKGRYEITYNGIGKLFEETVYDYKKEKDFDFLTIRSILDGSKYCVDIVNELAYRFPNFKFIIIGKGKFFYYYKKAPNLVWVDKNLNHQEIIEYIQRSRCALMPTRTDAQGVMMCEMASTGIPLITSDIPVCHEVFDAFPNVAFMNNEFKNVDLESILRNLESGFPYSKNAKYFWSKTVQNEIRLIKEIENE